MAETGLIVGASRGLGLVQEFLRCGWDAVGTDRAGKTLLGDLALHADGRLAVELLDITDASQTAELKVRLLGESLVFFL